MTVITRFAPSPTGFLHIGGARTALFSWLYARRHGGKFLLRVEDTDRERSTTEAVDAILEGLKWMGLDWDGEEVYQFSRAQRHREVVQELIKRGNAYYCYCTKEELEDMRDKAKLERRQVKYDGTWRDRDPKDAPKDVLPSVRLKAPLTGDCVINDHVQGRVVVKNEELDDMILLRSDGTPTYMLAVVVDDQDMGVTHVIRGDDHLTNAFRQKLIYDAMGWKTPEFAHIPLIHGPDGAKLSKRHGALGVDAYRDMGYLPEAMRNYLLRLGWSHGDDEIISTEQAIAWFDLEHIGQSPARFDFDKLNSLNAHYIRESDDELLLNLLQSRFGSMTTQEKDRLLRGMTGLKTRAKTLNELAENAAIYLSGSPKQYTDKAKEALDNEGKNVLGLVLSEFDQISNWECDNIELALRTLSERSNIKLGQIMAPVRAAVTGSHASPSMFEVMEILGRDETVARIKAA